MSEQPSSTEELLSGIPLTAFVESRVKATLDGSPHARMRRFVWYYRDEPTEGLLCSNGHVVQDVCDWREQYHFPSYVAFEAACCPEYVVWIDPEVPETRQ